ncbi:TIGR03745 family integrating conjugative element membrane protein [Salmonella enterica subsp. enterica serovar Louisiana]|uniref:TIGR03745 family integrating conjugative element membrane protein n=1 Tax=Enterobacteriaceae TaxID=543 RepID=UPI000BE2349E|nr:MULTISPECIES: TIGR03745 family integrating conjugative element membrane protein [Enterobacteriaceae]EBW7768174.1 TIGR03745 family integrating conjugative element membrane protein [Salmonella enterica subsp. enterica serovar Louisiana]ECQ6399636.1 TIGR03745 family integrating conjugative element membrane protein [Salmonella enterica subsp. enterica serovar Onireke]ECY3521708.1 TIGR03745 family integrating conjugative element membrane protein [Salmonella enterica subsp. enterica serovar Ridge]
MFCSALSSLHFSFRLCCARVLAVALTGISAAHAGLPTVEGPKSSTDSSFYGQISGYLNDGIVLGGLILAAVAMLAVGNAIIATFAEVRDGKSTWAKFGMLCVVGVILIVVVIWLASKAATVLL